MSKLFSDRVKALDLPLDQLIVVASGIMGELEIRDPDDIDIVASQELFQTMSSRSNWEPSTKMEWPVYFNREGKAEMFLEWAVPPDGEALTYEDLLKTSIVINDVRYVTLDFLYHWKEWYGREKDFADRELIKEYWENQRGQ